MSERWQVRFEIVAGPNDGLTFAVTDQDVVLDGELLGVPPDIGLTPKDLDDVELEVDDAGVALTCEVTFWLNGAEVTGRHPLHEGDIIRVGMTEMLCTGHTSEPAAEADTPGTPGGGTTGATSTDRRKCLRPGCGAMNPPDAKWCLACGWDLEEPT